MEVEGLCPEQNTVLDQWSALVGSSSYLFAITIADDIFWGHWKRPCERRIWSVEFGENRPTELEVQEVCVSYMEGLEINWCNAE